MSHLCTTLLISVCWSSWLGGWLYGGCMAATYHTSTGVSYQELLAMREHHMEFQDSNNENELWGSGYSNDDAYDYSGDGGYDDDEDWNRLASGDGMISPCQSLLDEMQGKSLHGAYIPQCTDQGEFDSMQCWGSTGECWCVTEAGAEIDNTRRVRPDQPQCDDVITRERIIPVYEKPVNTGAQYPAEPMDPPHDNEESATVDIQTIAPSLDTRDSDNMRQQDAMVHTAYSSLTAKPGILAGVIGGAVVGLLCAVLLVMFIVYRMRKKDEGSYSLDAPKRSPSLHTYSRASNREFYA